MPFTGLSPGIGRDRCRWICVVLSVGISLYGSVCTDFYIQGIEVCGRYNHMSRTGSVMSVGVDLESILGVR